MIFEKEWFDSSPEQQSCSLNNVVLTAFQCVCGFFVLFWLVVFLFWLLFFLQEHKSLVYFLVCPFTGITKHENSVKPHYYNAVTHMA